MLDQLPEDWRRAMCVVAHPDDMEYGLASAVARWTKQGKHVAYVMVTSGEAGIDRLHPDQCRPLRENEQRRGAAAVGVSHVDFLGYPDGIVEYGLTLRRDIAASIRRLRPDVVFTANFDLCWGVDGPTNHPDHRAVGLAVLDACRDAANRWLFPELSEPWQGLRGVYVASMDPPSHYVDVSDTLDAGIASLLEHKMYLEGLGDAGHDPEAFLRNAAAAGGRAAGVDMAVLFRHMR
jgi:LmbE family N-acetylglucosaminyl deacetylase